jgi:hypothetical protein
MENNFLTRKSSISHQAIRRTKEKPKARGKGRHATTSTLPSCKSITEIGTQSTLKFEFIKAKIRGNYRQSQGR